MFNIVLVQPEIPPNTGNVIRLAANTGCALHLVGPLGFAMEDRQLRRAGLDYHEYASVRVYSDWAAFLAQQGGSPHSPCPLPSAAAVHVHPTPLGEGRGGGTVDAMGDSTSDATAPHGVSPAAPRMYALTTRGQRAVHDVAFLPGDWLVFGSETSGLPADVRAQFDAQHLLRLPMRQGQRSLNLSNAVAVVVYEAWRQNGFAQGGFAQG